jgi:dTDP-4-dehydrorhamnose 3,5-epimerase
MEFYPTNISYVVLIRPKVFSDDRGYFMEIYQEKTLKAADLQERFVQENQSGSCQGTLRGLHYQIKYAQGKLIGVLSGNIFDVVVDIRRNSPT